VIKKSIAHENVVRSVHYFESTLDTNKQKQYNHITSLVEGKYQLTEK